MLKVFKSPLALMMNALILLLLVIFSLHSWYGPDIWHHLSRGQQMFETGQFNPEQRQLISQPAPSAPAWLFQALVYMLFQLGGVYLISVVFAGLWIAIGVLQLKITQAFRHPFTGAAFFLAFALCIQLRMEHRPELISYLLMALITWLLLNPGAPLASPLTNKRVALIVALQMIWTNVHGYFVFGIGIAGAYLAAILIEKGPNKNARLQKAGLLLFLITLATLVHPDGYESWTMVYHYAVLLNEMKNGIEEFAPTYSFEIWWPMQLYWGLIAACGVWAVVRIFQRKNIFAALLVFGGTAVALQSFRCLAIFLILAGPAMGQLIEFWATRWSRPFRAVKATGPAVLILTTVFFITVTVNGAYYIYRLSGTAFGISVDKSEYPIGAVEYLNDIDFKGRLFTDPSDGSFVEFWLPAAQVPGDSYFADAEATNYLIELTSKPEVFKTFDHKLAFQGALVPLWNSAMLKYFLDTPDWKLAYSDINRLVFLRAQQYPGAAVELSEGKHYEGEDLRRWSYIHGPNMWAELALVRKDRKLLIKVIADLEAAPVIPSDFIKTSLLFALLQKDVEVKNRVEALIGRIMWAYPDDEAAIYQLRQQLGP